MVLNVCNLPPLDDSGFLVECLDTSAIAQETILSEYRCILFFRATLDLDAEYYSSSHAVDCFQLSRVPATSDSTVTVGWASEPATFGCNGVIDSCGECNGHSSPVYRIA